ncbi:MAG: hypothetical protein ACFFFG_01955 [Candidatus Thorarchaeota archaeon]
MTKEASQEKPRYKFDLTDGIGREDAFAIIYGIGRAVLFILKIIFWPLVWLGRIFNRSVRFARVKDTKVRRLTRDERLFIESIPTFFILAGIFIGGIIAIIEFFLGSDAIIEFIEEISLDTLIASIVWWLTFILEIILTIIGLGNHHMNLSIAGYDIWVQGEERTIGIIDWIRALFTFLFEFVQKDPIVLFLTIGAIGIGVTLVWILVSETGAVTFVVSRFVTLVRQVVGAPRAVYNQLNAAYLGFNNRLSSIVIGSRRLDQRSVAFHRKILLLTLGLGLYTFVGGIFVIATQNIQDHVFFISVILVMLTAFGLGIGIVGMFIIVRLLDRVSRGKYDMAPSST